MWDAKAPAVLAAKRGVLFIKDGSFEKQLDLDHEQLMNAGVVYSPGTTDVSFRLELYGAGPQPLAANVRLLAGSRPQPAAEAPTSEAVAPPVMTEPPPPAADAQPSIETGTQPPSDAQATMAAAPRPEAIPPTGQ